MSGWISETGPGELLYLAIPARVRLARADRVGGSRYAKPEPVAEGAQRFERCSVSSSQRSRSNAMRVMNRARTARSGSSDPTAAGRTGESYPRWDFLPSSERTKAAVSSPSSGRPEASLPAPSERVGRCTGVTRPCGPRRRVATREACCSLRASEGAGGHVSGPLRSGAMGGRLKRRRRERGVHPPSPPIAEWRVSVSAQSERTKAAVSSPSSGRPEASLPAPSERVLSRG